MIIILWISKLFIRKLDYKSGIKRIMKLYLALNFCYNRSKDSITRSVKFYSHYTTPNELLLGMMNVQYDRKTLTRIFCHNTACALLSKIRMGHISTQIFHQRTQTQDNSFKGLILAGLTFPHTVTTGRVKWVYYSVMQG